MIGGIDTDIEHYTKLLEELKKKIHVCITKDEFLQYITLRDEVARYGLSRYSSLVGYEG